MKDKTKEKIIKYINSKERVTAVELVDYLSISRQALFKHHLSKLVKDGTLSKIGKPPNVFYMLGVAEDDYSIELEKRMADFINNNYLIITPRGDLLEGVRGFAFWCKKNNLPIKKTAEEYIKTVKKYQRFKKNGLIDGTGKFKKTFNKVYLDKVFYFDFYSIERFGKTKLGQMLLYGKQSGNKELIKKIMGTIRPDLDFLIKKYGFDAVGYIPWTIKRNVQIMQQIKKQLDLPLKIINIKKVKTGIIIPQKTLNKLADRVINAEQTLVVEGNQQYEKVLLIDDAVGSGSTLNEVARQLKRKKMAKKVVGVAITGSLKGFDVISEV